MTLRQQIEAFVPGNPQEEADKALLLDYNGDCQFGTVEEIVNENNMKRAFNVEVKILDHIHKNRTYKGVIPLSILA